MRVSKPPELVVRVVEPEDRQRFREEAARLRAGAIRACLERMGLTGEQKLAVLEELLRAGEQ